MKYTPMIPLFLFPTYAYAIQAQVDFSKTVEEHAMLIILFGIMAILGAIGVGKYYLNKLDEKTKKSEDQEERIYDAELKLKDQEIKQLKDRVDKIENEHNTCNRTLPLSYVTRAEYDKFTEQHRIDLNGITARLENMMKDLKVELKEDMQQNIERIINLLNEVIKKGS